MAHLWNVQAAGLPLFFVASSLFRSFCGLLTHRSAFLLRVDFEAGVRFLFIPFEAGEVGLFEFVVLLYGLLACAKSREERE
jgi:hypothetical protein